MVENDVRYHPYSGHQHCSVPCCSNSKRTRPDLAFHQFPTDTDLRIGWPAGTHCACLARVWGLIRASRILSPCPANTRLPPQNRSFDSPSPCLDSSTQHCHAPPTQIEAAALSDVVWVWHWHTVSAAVVHAHVKAGVRAAAAKRDNTTHMRSTSLRSGKLMRYSQESCPLHRYNKVNWRFCSI